MPIYDYLCTSCGCKKEVMRKISEPNLTDCPECGKATFAKQLSAPSFQLSGSGWYATDFKNGGAKPASKEPEAAPAKKEAESAPAATGCASGCACH
jgi:putative FmdB family regulatory protein